MKGKIVPEAAASYTASIDDFLGILNRAHTSACARSRGWGWECDLALPDLHRMFEEQRGRCAVSGVMFSRRRYDDCLVKRPFAPSLDRINSHGGYVRGNVRLVCVAVNFGRGQWGDEVFRTLAISTAKYQPPLAAQPVASLDERIGAAVDMLPLLPRAVQASERRRIAALKRARTLGKEGLRAAATKARESIAAKTKTDGSFSRSC